MNRFWDSDGEDSDKEVLCVNVTSDDMELEAGRKSEASGGKDELSLAERLARREKKKADKKRRAQKRIEAMKEGDKEDDSTSTNTVEEVIEPKRRKIKRKKMNLELPEIKLMRVDEVEEEVEGTTEDAGLKMEVEEENVEKADDKENGGEKVDDDTAEEVKKEEVEQPEESMTQKEAGSAKAEQMEEDPEIFEIRTRKEARKEASRWKKALDEVRDMLDEFEDSGMARAKVRKCRRNLEGAKGGLARLAESQIRPDNREEIGKEETGKFEVKDEKMMVKTEDDEDKAVGSTMTKKVMMPIIVEQWVIRWSDLGKDDVKIQVFGGMV